MKTYSDIADDRIKLIGKLELMKADGETDISIDFAIEILETQVKLLKSLDKIEAIASKGGEL